MAEFDNTNRITLFHNDKQGKESRPDLNGRLNVNGTEYTVSIWAKESMSGLKFFSGQIQLREAKPNRVASENNGRTLPADYYDDRDIPF